MSRPFFLSVPYFLQFAFSEMIGRPLPAVGGLSVTDVCNLDCIHCWRKNTGAGHQSFEEILRVLNEFYRRGVRYLYLQGGEPYTYQDDGRTIVHIVAAARQRGFFHISVCTNGSFPMEASCDSHWISLDGLKPAHDLIRGNFGHILENLPTSRSRAVYANVTLNRINVGDLPELAELVGKHPVMRGLMVNFHIPLPGVEHLTLPIENRRAACQTALDLKRRGLPILNTPTGLKALASGNWKRPLSYSLVSDVQQTFRCCRANGNPKICEQCGYALWAEMSRWRRLRMPELFGLAKRFHLS